jgi:hypothetical protein
VPVAGRGGVDQMVIRGDCECDRMASSALRAGFTAKFQAASSLANFLYRQYPNSLSLHC